MNLSKSELSIVRNTLPPTLKDIYTDSEVEEFYLKNKDKFTDIPRDRIDNISNTSTANGSLLKWVIHRSNVKYFVKASNFQYGEFIGYEPQSEYIASRVGKILNLPVCDIELEDTKVLNKEIVVSVSPSVLDEDEILVPLSRFLSATETKSPNLLELLIVKFPMIEDFLYRQIVFDFLINNIDRHLNNIWFICDAFSFEIKRVAPLLDNGLSLLADVGNDRLASIINLDRNATSKPFRSRQYKQIKLVPKDKLFAIEDMSAIKSIIEGTISLPHRRKEAILQLITIRNNYVKELILRE